MHAMRNRRQALWALGSSLAPLAWAQTPGSDYPAKAIKVVVPFPAGGGGDNLARLVLSRLGPELGQPIVFENIGGAGGNVGVASVTRAAPDGYTLSYGTNGTHAINQTLYKNPGFDPLKNFEPLGRLSRIAALVVVRPGLQVSTMRELLDLLKKNPGKFSFASAGNGTTSHLAGEILKAQAGVSAVHIPYRGGAAAMVDMLADRIDFMIDVMPSTAPQVRSGRLRGLAVSTAQRVTSFPDIPTIAESGVPGYEINQWNGLLAPPKMPAALVARLSADINDVLAQADVRARLGADGSEAVGTSPQFFAELLRTEIAKWKKLSQDAGIRID